MAIPSDRDLISKQDHELNYVLKKYGKRQTEENRNKLSEALDIFLKDDSYETYMRKDFYDYVDKNNALKDLQDS
ncbi:MAG: hypothetical protein KAG20_11415 [Cocleimonas sp.]|nr:hypothetical protein [Cocleimonas sp.]